MAIPPQLWFELIEESLEEMSDLRYQYDVWVLNKIPNIFTSFTELICVLYDDTDFEGFLDKVRKHNPQSKFLVSALNLDTKLNQFLALKPIRNPNNDDRLVINDPEWHKIVELAKHALADLQAERQDIINMPFDKKLVR